jgi:hypothetical protein
MLEQQQRLRKPVQVRLAAALFAACLHLAQVHDVRMQQASSHAALAAVRSLAEGSSGALQSQGGSLQRQELRLEQLQGSCAELLQEVFGGPDCAAVRDAGLACSISGSLQGSPQLGSPARSRSPAKRQPAASCSLQGLAARVAQLEARCRELAQQMDSKAGAGQLADVQRQADQVPEQLSRCAKGVEGLRKRWEEQAAQLQRVARVLAAAAQERPTSAVVEGMLQVRRVRCLGAHAAIATSGLERDRRAAGAPCTGGGGVHRLCVQQQPTCSRPPCAGGERQGQAGG